MLLMREALSCALIHRQTVADGARSAAPIGGGRRQAVAGAARLATVVAFVVCALPLSAAGQATDAESGETKPALEELAPASSPAAESGAIEPQSAIAGGANFGIGFQVPVGQRRGVIQCRR